MFWSKVLGAGAVLGCLVLFVGTGAVRAADCKVDFDCPTRFNLSVNGSSGLVRSASPETLGRFRWAAGLAGMNWDRDPGDVDFVEVTLQGAVGLPGRLEAFFRASPTLRTNSVNQDPVRFPPPPLDMVIDVFPDTAQRNQPWLMFTQEAPYKTYFVPGVGIRVPTRGAHGRGKGDFVAGLKASILLESEGRPFSLGIQGYGEFPAEKPTYNVAKWRDKAGVSGERDYGLDLIFGKNVKTGQLIGQVGYKKVGDPERGFTVQYVNSGAEDPADFVLGSPVEIPLDLKDEVRLSAGFTVPVFKILKQQVWFLSEIYHVRYVGSGTPVQRIVHPVDLVLGAQFNPGFAPWLSIGGAWLMYLNSAGNGSYRDSAFISPTGQGDINFSELVDPDLSDEVRHYLSSRGVVFSESSNKIFSTNNPAFDAWRNIPSEPGEVISRGGGAGILFLTIRP